VKYALQKKISQNGFTLLEVIIAMSLFIIVLVIASNAFNRIVTQSSIYSKMEETNIEGVVGLEIMRHDLGQMGFGLPWGFSQGNATPPTDLVDSTITYSESVDTLGSSLNDAPNGVPRALASFAAIGAFSSDYISLKGTTLGSSEASQRWTYIPFHNYSATPRESRPVSFSSNNPQASDRVIFINSNVNDITNKDHRLIVYPSNPTKFSASFSTDHNGIDSSYLPINDLNTSMVYGIDSNGSVDAGMPFNRADYFIKTGNAPPFCEQNTTGVLYKATVNQGGGGYTYIPLLDCVADMQVVLGWDTSDGGLVGAVDAYSSLPKQSDGTVTATPSGASGSIQGWLTNAQGIREHLKVVKVYILAQEGKRDTSYKSPITNITVGDLSANGFRTKADYVLSTAQQQYRWKLYRIVVSPRNLVSNQH
jgi:prepilin-type N-terminal cleavage/methylation domain-containing protein